MTNSAVFDKGRIASSLNDANNDTGRIAYCGPYVVSAITGWSISKIEDAFRRHRAQPDGSEKQVKGTDAEEVGAVLAEFGFTMSLRESFMDLAKKERPSVWSWMQKPRNAWSHYILAISKGKEGHWILIKGVKMCDTYTDGRWKFVCDGPHRGAKIMEIFEVRKET
ncbi:MAG: hypothetical protein RLZ98_1230 [Pseudomonadota bacterium]